MIAEPLIPSTSGEGGLVLAILPYLDVSNDLLHEQCATCNITVSDYGAEEMRTAREFLSSQSSFDLASGMQFTIEPQCVSMVNHDLPKVMIHYVAELSDENVVVCRACDKLPAQYGLT